MAAKVAANVRAMNRDSNHRPHGEPHPGENTELVGSGISHGGGLLLVRAP
jgi:hypothetical protein